MSEIVKNKQKPVNIEELNKKSDDAFNIASNLLYEAHHLFMVEIAAKDINETIENYDRKKAIYLILLNIEKYKNAITFLAKFTGREIIYCPNFYNNKTDEYILCDLKYLRLVIYANEIKNIGLEFTFKKTLDKLKLF